MHNIQTEINSNITKTWLIMGIFTLLVGGTIYLITQLTGMGSNGFILSMGISLAMSLGSYFYGSNLVLSLHGAKEVGKGEYDSYTKITKSLANSMRLPMPKLYIIQSPALNAFATGRDPNHAVLCVTTGIINSLTREELTGVLAHELGHVQNLDIRLLTVVSILLGLMSSAVHYFQFSSMFGGRRDNRDSSPILGVLGIFLIIFAPIIATLIQLAVSRQREYLADATSAKVTHNPRWLISALQKISQNPKEFAQAQPATATMYISNPFANIKGIFSTHPPVEDRIRALEKFI